MPKAVAIGSCVVTLARKAPIATPGQTRGPQQEQRRQGDSGRRPNRADLLRDEGDQKAELRRAVINRSDDRNPGQVNPETPAHRPISVHGTLSVVSVCDVPRPGKATRPPL